MTPEQFVFWLNGYFTGGRGNDDDCIVADIKEGLKKVKIRDNAIYAMKIGEFGESES